MGTEQNYAVYERSKLRKTCDTIIDNRGKRSIKNPSYIDIFSQNQYDSKGALKTVVNILNLFINPGMKHQKYLIEGTIELSLVFSVFFLFWSPNSEGFEIIESSGEQYVGILTDKVFHIRRRCHGVFLLGSDITTFVHPTLSTYDKVVF